MTQRRLKFLGTGSCFNIKAGNNCAYYYNEKTGFLILFDCGEDIFRKIVMKFKNLRKVVIVITHFHSDHIGSLPSFIYYCNIAFSDLKPIIIYPDNCINKLLKKMGVANWRYIHKKSVKSIETVKVEHFDMLKSYGYVIKFGKTKIYYSGDSKNLPLDILERFIEGDINYIYHDMTRYRNDSHMNVDDMAKLIPKNLRKYVYAMHLDDNKNKIIAIKYGFKIAK